MFRGGLHVVNVVFLLAFVVFLSYTYYALMLALLRCGFYFFVTFSHSFKFFVLLQFWPFVLALLVPLVLLVFCACSLFFFVHGPGKYYSLVFRFFLYVL